MRHWQNTVLLLMSVVPVTTGSCLHAERCWQWKDLACWQSTGHGTGLSNTHDEPCRCVKAISAANVMTTQFCNKIEICRKTIVQNKVAMSGDRNMIPLDTKFWILGDFRYNQMLSCLTAKSLSPALWDCRLLTTWDRSAGHSTVLITHLKYVSILYHEAGNNGSGLSSGSAQTAKFKSKSKFKHR